MAKKRIKVLAQEQGENFALYNGDSTEILQGIPENSIHYCITSIPFASLYTYSNSERDMGNCKSHDEFWEQYMFLGKEWYRVMMPGRCVSVHCMNLPTSKERDGVIGLIDFRGQLIRWMQQLGFIYHSEVCIWKNPVTAMQRTKALGLLHKQIKKDSCMSRMGIPDYVVTFRKPGDNSERVTHTNETYPVSHWQEVASPIWEEYASPVWWDINQSDTLNGKLAREDQDERHICLAEGTLVLTKRGYIPIETINIGDDEVLTNSGEWHRVIAKAKTAENVPVIQTVAQGVPKLVTTPDHRIMAKKFHYWAGREKKEALHLENEEWTMAKDCEKHYLKSVMPPELESNISAQEWWIIGRWLADGHIDARGKQFFISIGKQKWDAFKEKADGHIGAINDKPECNCFQVGLIGLSEESRAILKKCGHGATNKVMPVECISLNKELSTALYEGYLSGDGHLMADGKQTASSASRSLLLGMAIVAQKVSNKVASVYAGRAEHESYIQGRKICGGQEWNMVISPHYSFSAIQNNGTWKKVKLVKDAGTSDVWSIEVEIDHSYMAEGCIVKNCPLQLPVIERCVELWSNPGDIVLDPFNGIGSTGYQSLLMGRRYIGIELKESYYKLSCKNLKEAEEKKKLQPTSLFDEMKRCESD